MTEKAKKTDKVGTIEMKVKFDEKGMWNNVRSKAQQNQNSAEALTMMSFVMFFILIALGVAFSALEWEIAYLVSSGLMVASILCLALLQWYSFRQMKLKHKAIEKLDEIETKELEEKLAKESVVVNDDGKPVKISVKELVVYSTRIALEAYKKELAEMDKKLKSKDGQPKKNKRK